MQIRLLLRKILNVGVFSPLLLLEADAYVGLENKAINGDRTGQVVEGDCRSKQDTYKRMNASRIQSNIAQAEVKVSVVFAVV